MPVTLTTLKQGTILFWALWLTIVFLSNVVDALKALGVLPRLWTVMISNNYDAIRRMTAKRRVPEWMNALMFGGVIVYQAMMAYLFWRALLVGGEVALYAAFGASLMLWAVFILVDELFVEYEIERIHMSLFVAKLITLMFIVLMPD